MRERTSHDTDDNGATQGPRPAGDQAKRSAASMGREYVRLIPRASPPGRVLVHNRVPAAHPDQHPTGLEGFRAWFAEPTAHHVRCDCGWAPHLPEHYVALPNGKPAP